MPNQVKIACKASGEVLVDAHSHAGKCTDIAKQVKSALKGMSGGPVVDHDHQFDKDEKVQANVASR